MKIRIEWLSDTFDCETCGTSLAEGAYVTFEDGSVINMPAIAHCTGGEHYDQDEVYDAILKHLGHEVVYE